MQEISLDELLNGGFGLLKFAPETLLSEAERQDILLSLKKMPYTFEYEGMPPCWGKAFENFLTVADYLEETPADKFIQELSEKFNQKIVQILENKGVVISTLQDPKSGKPYWTGNFRCVPIPANSTSLHVDDLRLDAHFFKSDFVLPTELENKNFVQLYFLYHLENESVGTLRIYNRRYSANDERFRLENNWQFADEAVGDAEFIDFEPQTGDFYLMTNQYFHDILGQQKAASWLYYSVYLLYVPEEKRGYLYI